MSDSTKQSGILPIIGDGFVSHKALKKKICARNHLSKRAYWELLKELKNNGVITYTTRGVRGV